MNKTVTIIVVIIVVVIIGIVLVNRSSTPVAPVDTSNTDVTITPAATTTDNTTPVATSSSPTAATKEFTVDAKNYSFSPSTITVNKGDIVKITLKNTGGFHDLRIDEFGVSTKQIQGGTSETVQFVADKAGSFQYYCSVANHRAMGMVGTLIVK